MSAEVQDTTVPLSKVDSAIDESEHASPGDIKPKHRRTSSVVSGVFNILDLGEYQSIRISQLSSSPRPMDRAVWLTTVADQQKKKEST